MKFSEYYNVKLDNFFDPIMETDTKLFIDPFQLFKSEDAMFLNTYNNIMEFFNCIYQLIAESKFNENSIQYKKAYQMLLFSEVDEICLGYSVSKGGSGPNKERARLILESIEKSIKAECGKIEHFEEIGILGVGIGRDHISDMTANFIKDILIELTQKTCVENNIPMKLYPIKNIKFNRQFLKWEHGRVQLPENPCKKNKGVILVPTSIINNEPEINDSDFLDYAFYNEILRTDLNYEIDKNINKEEIVKLALEYPQLLNKYIEAVRERPAKPYDLIKDELMFYKWYDYSAEISKDIKISNLLPDDNISFNNFIKELTEGFKNYIELNSGYKLLWDEKNTKPKSEESVQLLYFGYMSHFCKANNIDMSREVNQGRGPVDFKFSQGYQTKSLVEIKLAKNSKFWNGIEKQLPMYMESENLTDALFLVVMYTANDAARIKDISTRVKEVNKMKSLNIQICIIDATHSKESAST